MDRDEKRRLLRQKIAAQRAGRTGGTSAGASGAAGALGSLQQAVRNDPASAGPHMAFVAK